MTLLDLHNKIIGELNENPNLITDKGGMHEYIQRFYDDEFTPKKLDNITIVEIGVWNGGSVDLFGKWFENGKIIGIDNFSQVSYDMVDSVKLRIKNINNAELIIGDGYHDDIVNQFKDESIDYLIDDGSHIIENQIDCVKKYYSKIKKGGKIIIEDILDIDRNKVKFDELNLPYQLIDLRFITMDFYNPTIGAQHLHNNVLAIFKK